MRENCDGRNSCEVPTSYLLTKNITSRDLAIDLQFTFIHFFETGAGF